MSDGVGVGEVMEFFTDSLGEPVVVGELYLAVTGIPEGATITGLAQPDSVAVVTPEIIEVGNPPMRAVQFRVVPHDWADVPVDTGEVLHLYPTGGVAGGVKFSDGFLPALGVHVGDVVIATGLGSRCCPVGVVVWDGVTAPPEDAPDIAVGIWRARNSGLLPDAPGGYGYPGMMIGVQPLFCGEWEDGATSPETLWCTSTTVRHLVPVN